MSHLARIDLEVEKVLQYCVCTTNFIAGIMQYL